MSVSPSTSASSSAVTMSSRGLRARVRPRAAFAYMNISTCAFMTSSAVTMYSGSSDPIIRLLHSKSLCRSSCGTPSISAMTCSGTSAATSTTKSQSPCFDHVVEDLVGELADVRLDHAHLAGREAAVDELAVARVLGRVHREHEVAALLELVVLGPALELHDAAALLVGGVTWRRRGPTVMTSACLVITQKPGPPGSGWKYTGASSPQVREPLVRDTLGEPVPVEQVDVAQLHAFSQGARRSAGA